MRAHAPAVSSHPLISQALRCRRAPPPSADEATTAAWRKAVRQQRQYDDKTAASRRRPRRRYESRGTTRARAEVRASRVARRSRRCRGGPVVAPRGCAHAPECHCTLSWPRWECWAHGRAERRWAGGKSERARCQLSGRQRGAQSAAGRATSQSLRGGSQLGSARGAAVRGGAERARESERRDCIDDLPRNRPAYLLGPSGVLGPSTYRCTYQRVKGDPLCLLLLVGPRSRQNHSYVAPLLALASLFRALAVFPSTGLRHKLTPCVQAVARAARAVHRRSRLPIASAGAPCVSRARAEGQGIAAHCQAMRAALLLRR